MKHIKLIVFSIFVCGIGWAQSPTFQFVGLSGEKISALAIHPQNDSILYAGSMSNFSDGTYGSVFKSVDAGATWDTVLHPVTVHDIAINPLHPETVYVGLGGANFTSPGIVKTTDGGITWTRADSGVGVDWETFVQDVELHPTHPGTLYAGTAGIGTGGLYRSVDGGQSWTIVGADTGLNSGPIAILIDPLHPDTMYCEVNWISEIYKTTDAGSTWQALHVPWIDGGPAEFTNHPEETHILYAGVFRFGFVRSVDGGLTWTHRDSVGIADTTYNVKDIIIDPAEPTHIYAAFCGGGYYGGLNNVYESFDSGIIWHAITTGIEERCVREMELTSYAIFAGTDSGMFRRDITTDLINERMRAISQFVLAQNYPNPFNKRTVIPYRLPEETHVTLSIYNLQGQMVKQLVNEYHRPGKYTVHWNGTNADGHLVSAGVYFYQMSGPYFTKTQALVYLK